MSCGHWLGMRRTYTMSQRLNIPIVAVRVCENDLVLDDGTVLECDGSVSHWYPAIRDAVVQRAGWPMPVDMRHVAYQRLPIPATYDPDFIPTTVLGMRRAVRLPSAHRETES